MNKKIIAATLAAATCASLLAACGKQPAQPAAGTTESTSGTNVTAAESTTAASDNKTETTAATETTAENTSAAPEQPSETEATQVSESNDTVDIPDEARTTAAFAGKFQSGRCSINVTAVSDTELRFEVHWSSGANEATEWEMTGTLMPDVLRINYSDCVRKEIVDGNETVVYSDGAGRIQYSDFNRFIWMDEQDNAGRDMEFTRMPG